MLAWTPPGALATLPYRLANGEYGAAAAGLAIALVALGLVWWWWGRSLAARLTSITSDTASSSPANASQLTSGSGSATVAARYRGADRPPRRAARLARSDAPVAVAHRAVHGDLLAAAGLPRRCRRPGRLRRGARLADGRFAGRQPVRRRRFRAVAAPGGLRRPGPRPRRGARPRGGRARAGRRGRGDRPGHRVRSCAATIPRLPAAAGVCFAALLGSCAIAGYMSAAMPFAMPQSRKSLFASSVPGQKGRTAGATFGLMLGGLISAIPAAVLALLAGNGEPGLRMVGARGGPAHRHRPAGRAEQDDRPAVPRERAGDPGRGVGGRPGLIRWPAAGQRRRCAFTGRPCGCPLPLTATEVPSAGASVGAVRPRPLSPVSPARCCRVASGGVTSGGSPRSAVPRPGVEPLVLGARSTAVRDRTGSAQHPVPPPRARPDRPGSPRCGVDPAPRPAARAPRGVLPASPRMWSRWPSRELSCSLIRARRVDSSRTAASASATR